MRGLIDNWLFQGQIAGLLLFGCWMGGRWLYGHHVTVASAGAELPQWIFAGFCAGILIRARRLHHAASRKQS